MIQDTIISQTVLRIEIGKINALELICHRDKAS